MSHHKLVNYRDLCDKNICKFRDELSKIDWTNKLTNINLHEKFEIFYDIIFNIYDNVMPIKTKKIDLNKKFCPWAKD